MARDGEVNVEETFDAVGHAGRLGLFELVALDRGDALLPAGIGEGVGFYRETGERERLLVQVTRWLWGVS